MSTIDDRVVQLKFDNKQFEQGVGTSLSTLDKLKRSLDFSSSTKSLGDLSSAGQRFNMGNIGSTIDGVSGKLIALGTIGVTALANITQQALLTGETIVKSLTLTPVTTGFQEYELKMNAIQTIMAGSGESLKTVNKYLEELNTYSDKTIYSFSDMTTNISKFTNAGVSLKESVAAIQGIANVAAISGANATDAGRAMYNFGQAISKGSVALLDWKSIEIANMATVEFKTQLLNAAVAQGTLTKKGDEYKTKKGTLISATKGFNESLQEQWLTSKALTTTLGDYSNEQTKIGKRATAAATSVKTLSQLYDTLKESAGSGWAKSFEIMFGGLDEAKGRWTALNDVVGGWIKQSAETRNTLLQQYKDIRGQKVAIAAMKDAFAALMSVVKPIKEAFREVFPPTTAQDMLAMTEKVRAFFKAITLGPAQMEMLKNAFKGLFFIFSLVKSVVGGIIGVFTGLFAGSGAAAGGLLSVAGSIGTMITNWVDFLKNSGAITAFFYDLGQKLQPVAEWISRVGSAITDAFANAPAIFSNLGGAANAANGELSPLQKTVQFLKNIWDGFVNALSSGVSIIGAIGGAIKDAFAGMGNGIGGAFSGVKDALANLDWTTIFKAGVGASSLAMVGLFLKALYGGINALISNPAKVLKSLEGALQGLQSTLKTYQRELRVRTLMMIAMSVLALAVAIKVLSTIDPMALGVATLAMGALFAELVIAMKQLEGVANSKSVAKIPALAGGIFLIAASMLVLAFAIKVLGGLDYETLGKGIVTIGIVLRMIEVFSADLSKHTSQLAQAGAGMLMISVALLILAAAILVYSKMDLLTLAYGLGAVMAVVAGVGLAMKALPKEGEIAKASASMILIAFALMMLIKPIQTLGGMPIEQLYVGIVALSGILLALVVGLNLMAMAKGNMISAAAALVIVSLALSMLVTVLKTLVAMGVDNVVLGMMLLIGVLVALGLTAIGLQAAIPLIYALGIAIAILGAGLLAIGLAALAFAWAMSLVVGIISLGVPFVTQLLNDFIALIPLLGEAFYQALVMFADVVIRVAPKMGEAFVAFISSILNSINTLTPKIVETLGVLLDALIVLLVDYIPKLSDAGWQMLQGILDGIDNHVGEITTTVMSIIKKFLTAIGDHVKEVVDAGTKIITNLIEGIGKSASDIAIAAGNTVLTFLTEITNWINNNSDRINTVSKELVKAIVRGLVAGVAGLGGGFIDAIGGLAGSAIDKAKEILHINSPSKVFISIGKSIVEGFVTGVVGGKQDMIDAMKVISDSIKTAKDDSVKHIKDLKEKIKSLEGKKRTQANKVALSKAKAELATAEKEKARLDNASKTLSVEHKKDIAKLVRLGAQWDVVSVKLDAAKQKYKDAVKERDDYAKSVKDSFSKLPTIDATSSLDDYFNAIRQATADNIKFKATMEALRKLGLDDNQYKKFMEQGTAIQPFLDQLLASGGSTITELNKIDGTLTDSATSLGKSASEALYQAGVDAAKGIVDGLQTQMDAITKQMKKLGKAIADELKKELGIKSPSKVMMQVGKYTVQGLAEGLDQNAKVIDLAARRMGKTAVSGLQDSLFNMSGVIGANFDINPTIAPVLDLDQFRKDAAGMNDILAANTVSPTTSSNVAGTISAATQAQQHDLAAANAAGNVVSLTQNNYSPVALSAADIYRQTRNQLSTVKGALGA